MIWANLPNEVKSIILEYLGNKCHTCNNLLKFDYYQRDHKFMYCSKICYDFI